MPVSTSMWTLGRLPTIFPAATINSRCFIEGSERSILDSIANLKSELGGVSQAIIGAVTPLLRSVSASSSKATPSQLAPDSSAQFATGTRPCP